MDLIDILALTILIKVTKPKETLQKDFYWCNNINTMIEEVVNEAGILPRQIYSSWLQVIHL